MFRAWAHDMTRDFRGLIDECLPAAGGLDSTVAANLILSMLSTLYRWYDPAGPVAPDELGEQIEKVLAVLFQY